MFNVVQDIANALIKITGTPAKINTKQLRKSAYFDNTTNLYGWNEFSGTYADSDSISGWIGGNDLTAKSSVGSISTITDHLGNANAAINLTRTSSQYVYDASTDHDTADLSFITGGKIKLDTEERADGRLACDSCW